MSLFTLVAALGYVVFFYRVGESEYNGSVLPGFVGLLLWVLGIFVFQFGMFMNLVLQAALFAGLTAWNIHRSGRD